MNETNAIAATILGWHFPRKKDVGADLYACLERVCPSLGKDRASLRSRNERYQSITHSVLAYLREGPAEVLEWTPNGESTPVLPLSDLKGVVMEVRREVKRWCHLALISSHRDVIPFYDKLSRTLYVDGKMAYQWSGHAPADGPQLLLVTAFQEEDWAYAINCPLLSHMSPTDTCRKLNKLVGKLIRFEVCGQQIRWKPAQGDSSRISRGVSGPQPPQD